MKHTVRSSEADGSLVDVEIKGRAAAIKMMCTECMGFESHPNECTDKHCPLFLFRGKSLKAYK